MPISKSKSDKERLIAIVREIAHMFKAPVWGSQMFVGYISTALTDEEVKSIVKAVKKILD